MTYDPLSYGEIKLKNQAAKPGETPDDILFEDAGPGYAGDEPNAAAWSGGEGEFDAAGPSGSAQELTQFGADVLGEDGRSNVAAPLTPTGMGTGGMDGMDLGGEGLESDDYGAGAMGGGDLGIGLDLDPHAVDVGSLDSGYDDAAPTPNSGVHDPSAIAGIEATEPPPAPMPVRRPATRRQSSGPAVPVREPAATPRPGKRARTAAAAPAAPARRPKRRARSSFLGTLMPTLMVAGGGSAAAWFYMMEQNVVMAAIVGVTSLVGGAFSRVLFK